MGRSLKMSLFNLGLNDAAQKALAEADISLDSIYEEEPDAVWATAAWAVWLPATWTAWPCQHLRQLLHPVQYGIFKRKIVDGWRRARRQLAARLVRSGSRPPRSRLEVASTARSTRTGIWLPLYPAHQLQQRHAIPPIMAAFGVTTAGALQSCVCGRPRLLTSISQLLSGNYNTAMSKNASAGLISGLYPNDNRIDWGQDPPACASDRYLLPPSATSSRNHLSTYGTSRACLPRWLCPAERYPSDPRHPRCAHPAGWCGFGWDRSFDICQKVFSPTHRHGRGSGEVERGHLQDDPAPHLQIVVEMDRRAREKLEAAFPGDQGKINYMALIGDNQVRMASICAYTASTSTASPAHSEIIGRASSTTCSSLRLSRT